MCSKRIWEAGLGLTGFYFGRSGDGGGWVSSGCLIKIDGKIAVR
jgi:hypothetical protein